MRNPNLLRSRRRRHLATALVALSAAVAPLGLAQQEIRTGISETGFTRIRLAFPDVTVDGTGATLDDAASVFATLVRNDLVFSGYFELTEPSLVARVPRLGDRIPYASWAAIGTEALAEAEVSRDGPGGDLTIEVRLFDVAGRQMVVGKRYKGEADSVPTMAHRFANEALLHFTGRRGIFLSQLAYVVDLDDEVKELHVMDYDGNRSRAATGRGTISLSPSWSPDGERLAFTSYENNRLKLFVLDRSGKLSRPVDLGAELHSAPAWSPDGRSLAFAADPDENVEIYRLDVDSGRVTQLTFHPAIDTSPSWSPGGRELAFTSDRLGAPQVFGMDRDGANVRRLTFSGSYNDAPAWSPDGRWLAYCTRTPTGFRIARLELGTGGVTLLTDGPWSDEGPAWSPDSNHIAFASNRTGRFQIYVMDADGSRQRRLTAGSAAYAPDWSPARP